MFCKIYVYCNSTVRRCVKIYKVELCNVCRATTTFLIDEKDKLRDTHSWQCRQTVNTIGSMWENILFLFDVNSIYNLIRIINWFCYE